MSGGGKAIRGSTVLAVTAVAVVAGWVSYMHAYDVVAAHGEHGLLARLYPGTIDGLIYSASMVLLDAARRGVRPPRLARWLLAAGISATLFANVLAGAAFGFLGGAVAAWPAFALVGSYELLMSLVRSAAARKNAPGGDLAAFPGAFPADPESAPAGVPGVFPETVPGPVPHPALEAAPGGRRSRSPGRSPAPAGNGKQPGPVTPERLREFYADDLAAGQVPSIREIKRTWPVGYEAASKLHDHLEAALTEP